MFTSSSHVIDGRAFTRNVRLASLRPIMPVAFSPHVQVKADLAPLSVATIDLRSINITGGAGRGDAIISSRFLSADVYREETKPRYCSLDSDSLLFYCDSGKAGAS